MPLFVFISGYFSKKVNAKSALKLIFIYLVFQAISLIAHGQSGLVSLFIPQWSLWYLQSLFFWRCLVLVLKTKRARLVISISVVMGLLIGMVPIAGQVGSLSRTFIFLPYFLMGYYCDKSHLQTIKLKLEPIVSRGLLMASILFSYILVLNLNPSVKFLYGSTSYQALGVGNWQGILIRLVCYALGIIASLLILSVINNKKSVITIFGRKSLRIYLVHIYIIEVFEYLMEMSNVKFVDNIQWVLLLCAISFLSCWILGGGLRKELMEA
jgi:fucose 4-O-acetylase-like acetyltransferase